MHTSVRNILFAFYDNRRSEDAPSFSLLPSIQPDPVSAFKATLSRLTVQIVPFS